MNKQEKIWHHVRHLVQQWEKGKNATEITDGILNYLHSQSVVLKVEGELPNVEITYTGWLTPSQIAEIGEGYRKAYANLVAVEPLVPKAPLIE